MNFLHILRRFVFLFLAFVCWIYLGIDSLASHFQESGLPAIQTYLPGAYTYVNHFNSIIQGKDGFIYIGTRNGILRYNGQLWQHIPANGDIRLVRHADNIIAYSKNQLLIVQATHPDNIFLADTLLPSGENKLSGQILQIISNDDKLFILTSTGLFIKSYNSFSEISTQSPAIRIFPSGEGIFILTSENRLFIHNGIQIKAHEFPVELDQLSDLISSKNMTIYVDGPGNKLILNRPDDGPSEFSLPVKFPEEFGYRAATALMDGMFALGTDRGGVFILDQRTGSLQDNNAGWNLQQRDQPASG